MAARGHAVLTPAEMAERVKRRAASLGFDRCGITDLSPTPHADALRRWLREGMAGTMAYMGRQARKRTHPADIVPGATRAVVVTRNYDGPAPPQPEGSGKVAKYARGLDYHAALRDPLTALATHLKALGDPSTIARWFVDAGPVPERELAQRAGLGWIGKNTMLIDPRAGSYFFIATVFTDLDLAIDQPFRPDRCGSCRRCLDACPTEAFADARVLDSRRCISYLTIEYDGPVIPEGVAHRMDGWVFGCDVCQEVCPWNVRFSEDADDAQLEQDPSLAHLPLADLAAMSDRDFSDRFGHTPLSRPGPEGMRRNARTVLSGKGQSPVG